MMATKSSRRLEISGSPTAANIGKALMRLDLAIRYSLLVLAAGALAMPARAVAADGAVAAFVDRINATVARPRPGDRKAIGAACATLVEAVLRHRRDGADDRGRSLGAHGCRPARPPIRAAWPGARPATARRMAARSPATRSSIVGVRAGEGGDRLVAVKQSKGRGRTMIWRVREGAGGALKAVDMTVDGRSLAASARSDAKAILKKTGGNVIALLRSVGE